MVLQIHVKKFTLEKVGGRGHCPLGTPRPRYRQPCARKKVTEKEFGILIILLFIGSKITLMFSIYFFSSVKPSIIDIQNYDYSKQILLAKYIEAVTVLLFKVFLEYL